MRYYETAFLIAPTLSEEETEQFISEMEDVVKKKKGRMIHVDKWGKRKLAYSIKRNDSAFYVFFYYEGGPETYTELERQFKQKEAVIRYLTFKRDEEPSFKEKEAKKEKKAKVEKPLKPDEPDEKEEKAKPAKKKSTKAEKEKEGEAIKDTEEPEKGTKEPEKDTKEPEKGTKEAKKDTKEAKKDTKEAKKDTEAESKKDKKEGE